MRMLSIDPGEVHCGYALWDEDKCYESNEWSPDQCMLELEKYLRAHLLDEVIIEEFQLYPWKSKEQGFSQLRTVRVIGALEYICARFGGPDLVVVLQPATIKKPTVAQNQKRGYKWLSRGHGGHAKDAETHGLYRIQKGRNG